MNLRISHLLAAAAALLAATVLVACGADNGSGGAGSGGPSLSVTAPTSGATVAVPFTLTVDTGGAELGAEDTGLHHLHVWFDDNEPDYVIVRSNSAEITEAPAGAHTMHVSLRNANHSPAGAELEVPIVVGGARDGPTDSPPATTDPYGY